MAPPEVWGPAVWSLFHTLAEKINVNIYPYIANQLFNVIVKICRFLPCPECASDASNFLAKIKMDKIKTKEEFKQTFYLFHNYVNSKKRKPLFNYSKLKNYSKYRLMPIINNFIVSYTTKGNMKLLNESFQRQLVLKDFKSWISANIKAFLPPINPPPNVVLAPDLVAPETSVEASEQETIEETVIEKNDVREPEMVENIVKEVIEEGNNNALLEDDVIKESTIE